MDIPTYLRKFVKIGVYLRISVVSLMPPMLPFPLFTNRLHDPSVR